MINRHFYLALVISLIIHASSLFIFSHQKIQIPEKKQKPMEVVYQRIKPVDPELPEMEVKDTEFIQDQEVLKPRDVKILSQKKEFLPSVGENVKDFSKLTNKFRLEKKNTMKMHSFDKTQKVSLSMTDSDKIDNPKYMSYYSLLSGKIIDRIYEALDDNSGSRGEVYVVFHLTADGVLQDVRIKEERTVASERIKSLALNSVRAASPFPRFPEGFNYAEFTFKVIVYIHPDE